MADVMGGIVGNPQGCKPDDQDDDQAEYQRRKSLRQGRSDLSCPRLLINGNLCSQCYILYTHVSGAV